MSYLIFCSFEVGGFPYHIARILNKYGVETYYIFLGETKSDHDSTRFHYGSVNENWDLSYMFNNASALCKKDIIEQLSKIKRQYNISSCLATGSKSYLLEKAGIPYIYWAYGSDLDQQCFKIIWPPEYPSWKKVLMYPHFILFQRPTAIKTIQYAEQVMISPYQIEALNKINSRKKLFFIPHLINVMNYDELIEKKLVSRKQICRDIQADRFFFSSVRHVWSGYLKNASDNKGNDAIIQSFKRYLDKTGDINSKLILIEKGPDIESTKLLACQLGIDKYVVYLEEMRRDELNQYYQGATLCFGQFGTPVLTYSILESLSNATPCISFYIDKDIRVPFYKEIPPVFNSKNPDEIAIFMSKITESENHKNEVGYKSWLWAKENCSEQKFVQSFLNVFRA